MEDIKKHIKINVQGIDNVTDMFYQQKEKEAYLLLDDVLKDMMSLVEELLICQKSEKNQTYDIEGLTVVLKEALSALERRDSILVADILKYEIKKKLEMMVENEE